MSDFTRYIVPNGGGVAEHPSGLLYHRKDVDPVVNALRARIRELEAEREKLREALRPFAATLERYSGFTEYALFGVWEDVNGAAGRKLNILRKQNFDDARAMIKKDKTNE